MPFGIVRNDITKMKVDAVVNAANSSLLGGGGVDGAIHRAAGPELLEECRRLNGCETGKAKITGGYRLPAKYVIHTVGPIWHGGHNGERELLSSCYRSSLLLAREYGCESVAFPLISSGAYGYPGDQAMAVAVEAITSFLVDNEMTVFLVVFGQTGFLAGKKLFRDVREYVDDAYVDRHVRPNSMAARRKLWREDEEAALAMDIQLGSHLSEARTEECLPDAAPEGGEHRERRRSSVQALKKALPDLDQLLKQTDEGFSQTLLRLIDERGLTDAECYHRANVDRKLFSKIRSNPGYKPSKPTVMAFAVALRLSLPEAKDLLRRAGFALTRSSRFDLILEYCLLNRVYDIYEINEVLFQYDQPLLGSVMN